MARLAVEGHMENSRVGLEELELYPVDGEDASREFSAKAVFHF